MIVTKTDLKGMITYANDVFLRMSACTEAEVLGQPHNVIRHPSMPSGIYKLIWDRLAAGKEVFAYIVNLGFDGVAYWVFAHATPTFDATGRAVAYHSTRRAVIPSVADEVSRVYAKVRQQELSIKQRRERGERSWELLTDLVKSESGMTTYEWVWSLASANRSSR